jgi:c-di-GMP-binding flagellar brake protein YcgR
VVRESKMEHPFHFNERRKYPRVSINLPLEYRESDNSSPEGGLVSNLSETGMLVYSIKDIPISSEFKTVVFFSNGFEFDGFRVNAKAIWKDLHFETGWKGYKYGLQFVQILEEDRWKLLNLLGSHLLFGGGL